MKHISENTIRDGLLLKASRIGVVLFRNHVGTGVMGKIAKFIAGNYCIIKNPRRTTFGLCVGSSDLVGWATVTVTPEMIGKTIAVFTAVETKSKYGKPSAEQVDFIDQVNKCGGYAGVAKLPESIISILGGSDGINRS